MALIKADFWAKSRKYRVQINRKYYADLKIVNVT